MSPALSSRAPFVRSQSFGLLKRANWRSLGHRYGSPDRYHWNTASRREHDPLLSPAMCDERKEPETIRWRPWPCDACAGAATAFDYLVGRQEASGAVPGGSPDEVVEQITARERPWLIAWVESCPHTQVRAEEVDRLDEGSEHIVYLVPERKAVLKLTKPGIYGDKYFLKDGLVHQICCTPGEYLLRLDMVKETFGFAAHPVGVTPHGQIASVQEFVEGEPPTQDEVDEFLLSEGIAPVKQSCWLWKKADPEAGVDFWIGDARADNFVKTPAGIVPIDIRMWAVVLGEKEINE